MSDPSDSTMRAETDGVTIGLIATPPDHPAQIVERLNDALPDLAHQLIGDGGRGRSVRVRAVTYACHSEPVGWPDERRDADPGRLSR